MVLVVLSLASSKREHSRVAIILSNKVVSDIAKLNRVEACGDRGSQQFFLEVGAKVLRGLEKGFNG